MSLAMYKPSMSAFLPGSTFHLFKQNHGENDCCLNKSFNIASANQNFCDVNFSCYNNMNCYHINSSCRCIKVKYSPQQFWFVCLSGINKRLVEGGKSFFSVTDNIQPRRLTYR